MSTKWSMWKSQTKYESETYLFNMTGGTMSFRQFFQSKHACSRRGLNFFKYRCKVFGWYQPVCVVKMQISFITPTM